MSVDGIKSELWSAGEAAAATGGHSTLPWLARGVSIDSRAVVAGDLFVALKGPNFDGHAFVADALAKGAVAALVSVRPGDVGEGAPLLVVGDTLDALRMLGQAARRRTSAKVIAVTGSVGKTGVKEALLSCLADQAPTYATVGSLNNHWGVPLSLARLPAYCRFGVFELGMNHAGEIGQLSRMVRPDVGLITIVAPAHMEFFSSLEAIADAKAELFEGMDGDGVSILNHDNPQFQRLQAVALGRGIRQIWSFGHDERADARVLGYSSGADGSVVTAVIAGEPIRYVVSLPGAHWVMNSLAVLLGVRALGGDVHAAALSLAALAPVKGRGTRKRIIFKQGAFTLIDESYNASPAAMSAAFSVLASTEPESGGRRLVVLGDMRELGERSDDFHADLLAPLVEAGVDGVFCSGPHMAALFERLPARMRGCYAADSMALIPEVVRAVRAGDVVLVKGSAGSRMGAVVSALASLDANNASNANNDSGKWESCRSAAPAVATA